MAPEIIKGDQQTFAVDWWSFGILIFEMIAGKTPFNGDSPKGILKSVLTNNVSLPSKFSKEVQDLIKKLLNPNPEKRLGSGKKGVNEIKTHKFFKGIDWTKVSKREYPVPYQPLIESESEVLNIDNSQPVGMSADRQTSLLKLGVSQEFNVSNFYFNVSFFIILLEF